MISRSVERTAMTQIKMEGEMQYTNGTSGGQCGTDVGDSRRGGQKESRGL